MFSFLVVLQFQLLCLSLIYFVLVFAYGVISGSNFILLREPPFLLRLLGIGKFQRKINFAKLHLDCTEWFWKPNLTTRRWRTLNMVFLLTILTAKLTCTGKEKHWRNIYSPKQTPFFCLSLLPCHFSSSFRWVMMYIMCIKVICYYSEKALQRQNSLTPTYIF